MKKKITIVSIIVLLLLVISPITVMAKNANSIENVNKIVNVAAECTGTILGDPNNDESVAWLINKILSYIKILGPMAVLILSGVDFAKALINNDDDTMHKSYKKLITRLVLILLLFFIPDLVQVLLKAFGFADSNICLFQ